MIKRYILFSIILYDTIIISIIMIMIIPIYQFVSQTYLTSFDWILSGIIRTLFKQIPLSVSSVTYQYTHTLPLSLSPSLYLSLIYDMMIIILGVSIILLQVNSSFYVSDIIHLHQYTQISNIIYISSQIQPKLLKCKSFNIFVRDIQTFINR